MPLFLADTPAAVQPPTVVVTAERAPEQRERTAASVSIVDSKRLDRLGEPLLSNVLRLLPSVAVATSGPAGSITEVRIRGAEANQTLLFIDGIRANDPAAGNVPRFELVGADLADRIELVRGPQSALWGSEAIGGVIALSSDAGASPQLSVEGGSFGFARAGGRTNVTQGNVSASVAGGVQRATGIDSFGAPGGDKDGYANLALRTRVEWRPSDQLTFAATSFGVSGRSAYDGYKDFVHADTADVTRNRLGAIGVNADWREGGWQVTASASILASRNRNLLAGDFVNQTAGERRSVGFQLARELTTGAVHHRFILAGDADKERFTASDAVYSGATGQRRSRAHEALTAEWRAEAGPLTTDMAVRRDAFNRFKDATTFRGSALLSLGRGWALTGSYGEGIAQPTFFDLYGFFPDSFVGNPNLKPERSAGWEAGIRYASGPVSVRATIYRQRLHDEIVDVFLPTFQSTTANATGTSKRAGLELEGEWQLSPTLRLAANYAYLKASERRDALDRPVQELRRPKHSGSLVLDGQKQRWTYGASLALVGDRRDTDFDVFPARTLTLKGYWLAGARIGYQLNKRVQLFGRVANAFDRTYQDVVGYRTEGASVDAGLRIGLR
ncbi:TonB-dependent receptor [Sphingomonas sp. KRR8]|uniref:TonB-dependent receptor plug domain-containing protein n=1 Tax=Sphingomonas sp. KRR8 TaxID=2942996 RepID=UPI0020213C86|nr:TonB-dependent receptor [Sphingomonas sp. KRR8]URD61636.1 TonB-dependent receptor [Sphingomonas sp. KRR8]